MHIFPLTSGVATKHPMDPNPPLSPRMRALKSLRAIRMVRSLRFFQVPWAFNGPWAIGILPSWCFLNAFLGYTHMYIWGVLHRIHSHQGRFESNLWDTGFFNELVRFWKHVRTTVLPSIFLKDLVSVLYFMCTSVFGNVWKTYQRISV